MSVALKVLDEARGAVLRRTMAFSWPRRLFQRRQERLVLLFLANTALLLPLAVWQPWFLLAAGPFVFGLAHLGSSVRYGARVPDESRRKSTALVLATMLAIVALVRFWQPPLDNLVEITGCCLVLLALSLLRLVGGAQMLLALVLLAPLFVASLRAPTETIRALVIAHNFVALGFWALAARRSGETRGPLFCLASFALIHAGLFAVPGNTFETVYAYGQAIHYFVWLRAIPEQHLSGTVPVSFRRSLKLLKEDFGRWGTRIAVALILALSATWLLMSWEDARHLYFAVAAFHGYAELTMLAVLGSAYLMGIPHSYQSTVMSFRSSAGSVLSSKSSPT